MAMQSFTTLAKELFHSTAKGSLLNFIPISYPENFTLCKKPRYNDLGSEVSLTFNF